MDKSFIKTFSLSVRKSPFFRKMRLRYDFYFKIKKRLTFQLSFLNKFRTALEVKGKSIFIPLIETKHYQIFQLLIIAKALELRGAKVKVLICGQSLDGCEVKSVQNKKDLDSCFNCRFNERKILPFFNLEILKLNDIITDIEKNQIKTEAELLIKSKSVLITKNNINLNQTVEESVTRFFYGNVPEKGEELKKVKFDHLVTAITSSIVASKIDEEWSPDIVLNNMASYSAWSPIYEYFKNNGNRFIMLSINEFNYHSLKINLYELFESRKRYTDFLSIRESSSLNPEESVTIKDFIKDRFNGNTAFFKDYNYFKKSSVEENIEKILKIDKKKKNIFLFSNIFWDIGISNFGFLFKDIQEWVLYTIKILNQKSNNIHLYIKPHPGEKKNSLGSTNGIEDIIRKQFPEIPDNITIINPNWDIKPYDLFPFIDLGVVNNGTLGLEMMYKNIPVVTTGKAPYRDLSLSIDPQTIDEYKKCLLSNIKPKSIDHSKLELFAYFYFIKTSVPFHLTKSTYADNFDGFMIKSLEDLIPGKDKYLDHLCNSILDSKNTIIEGWD
jgi:hypothetical protein